MNSTFHVRRGALQQQPRRPVNQQQQQSSGSGEFQPMPGRSWRQHDESPSRERQSRMGPSQAA